MANKTDKTKMLPFLLTGSLPEYSNTSRKMIVIKTDKPYTELQIDRIAIENIQTDTLKHLILQSLKTEGGFAVGLPDVTAVYRFLQSRKEG